MFSNKFDEWIFLQFSHLYECRIFSLLIEYILHGLRKELLIGFWRNFISKYLTFCHFITYWFFQKVWPREFKVDMNANIICLKAICMTLKNYILQSQRFLWELSIIFLEKIRIEKGFSNIFDARHWAVFSEIE